MKREHSLTRGGKNQVRFAWWSMAATVCFLVGSAEAQDPSYWHNAEARADGTISLPGVMLSELQQNAPVSSTPIVPPGGGVAAMALQVPAALDAEVAALAQALGAGQAAAGEDATAKALRIFNWVRNNLEYECYHGLRKGPALALLEGAGNDMDQCALLMELLKSAGYPAADMQLHQQSAAVDYDTLRSWMGLAENAYPGKTFQQVAGGTVEQVLGVAAPEDVAKRAWWGRQFLNTRGCGVAGNSGSPYIFTGALPGSAMLIFDRMIVEITIGGLIYQLDPSFKVHDSQGSGIDLAAASGYQRSALLTQAGGTADANTASGLSQTAVGTYMTVRATALHAAVGTSSMEQVVGGRRLADNTVGNLSQAGILNLTLPPQYGGTSAYFTGTTDPALAALKSTVRFHYTGSDPLDYTIPTAELKGRKISLTFTGNTAELRLDDALPASEAGRDPSGTVSGNTMDLIITVNHPTLGGSSEKKTYKKTTSSAAPCSYAIIYGFTTSERLLQKRHEQLRAHKDAGKAEDSREVRTELLNIMGLTWLRQTTMLTHALAAKNRVLPLDRHRFGRVAQEEGFYVDVGLQYSDSIADDGLSDDGRSDRVFNLGSLFWSAMEHGVIQQMQVKENGDPYDAVSTVNILRTANQAGGTQKIVLGRASNWSTVKPTLTGYDTYNGVPDPGEYTDANNNGSYDLGETWADQTIKQNLEWLVLNKSAQVLLPQSASITQGIWTGSGWVIRSPTLAGMIISGGYAYAGGYTTNYGIVTSPPVTISNLFNPKTIYQSSSVATIVRNLTGGSSLDRHFSSDPVDMATGGFVHAVEDLMTGLEEAPRGLGFTRDYSSNVATRDDQHIGYGWSHNLHIRANARTAEGEMLGMGSPRQAAVFLAAVAAASDLYRTDATPKEWAAASLVTAWMVDQMRNSGVSLRVGRDIHQFIAQPDGTYTAPTGSTMTLTKVSGAYQLKQRLGNTIYFDTSGKASKISDVDGREMIFTYHTDGRINYVQDHVSRRYTFGYDPTTKRITSVTDSTAPAPEDSGPIPVTPTRSVSFRYDFSGNLDRSTDPEGKHSYYEYYLGMGPHLPNHKILRLRNHDDETVVQNVYDALDRVERQFLYGDTAKTYRLYYTGRDNYEVDPQGGITHYLYDEKGRTAGKRDPSGNLTATTYDGEGRVAARTTATGETTSYTYDAFHNLKRIDHPRGGGFTLMDYDSLHRLDLVTDPHGIQTDYIYFTSGNDVGKDRPRQIISAKGTLDQSTTTNAYIQDGPAIGRVASVTDGDGLVTTKDYDANGLPDRTTTPGGFVTDENYDLRGDLRRVYDPNGRLTDADYNHRRQVTATTADQAGIAAVTDTGYDNQGRIASITPPTDNAGQRPQQTTTYTPTDKIRLVKLAGTPLSDTAYDSRDWSDRETDAAGRATQFVRHANGDLFETRKPGSRTTSFQYDGDNRLTASTNPGSNSGIRNEAFTYNTTPSGYPRTLKTEADSRQTRSDFDRMGRLRFFTDRGFNTYEFRYDPLGRRTRSITPQGKNTLTEYTKNGRVVKLTEPGGDTATYAYHPTTGRPTSVTYSGTGGGTVNFTSHDDNGNLLSLNENGANPINRTYDGLNRITSYTHAGQTIGYRYYKSGKLAKLIYPGGTENGTGHVEYTYDSHGRLYQVIDKLDNTASPRTTTYVWNPDGRLQNVTRPNGTVRTIGYDPEGRPQLTTEKKSGNTLLSWDVAYWPSDEIRTLDSTPAPPKKHLKGIPEAAMTFDSANRVISYNGQTIPHDSDGNSLLTPLLSSLESSSLASCVLTYDSRNRLTAANDYTYTYNAENHRTALTAPGETTSFLVDPAGALAKILARTKNGVTTRYVYGAGLQYEVNSAGEATYYHYDMQGNTAGLTNQAGTLIDRILYTPYGSIRYRMAAYDTPFLFGGFFGIATDPNGLIHMRARYYNPLTMRFLNSDPAQDGWNWYAYANGNPMSYADPTGYGANRVIDALQTGFTMLGFAPGVGAVADVLNAGISAARGDYFGASLSLAAAAPFIGDVAAAGRVFHTATQVTRVTHTTATVFTAVRVESAVVKGPMQVEQYALRAADSGFYPVMTRGSQSATEITWLEKGDVWKFGTTKNPATRYSDTFLRNKGDSGLIYTTEWQGTASEALQLEKMKIQNFQLQNGGTLPAGNKIVR